MKRLPKKGTEVIGWKKVYSPTTFQYYLAELLIPADAERIMGGTLGADCEDMLMEWNDDRKCRAEYVVVLGLWECGMWTEGSLNPAFDASPVAQHDRITHYTVGQLVHPDSYNPDPKLVCTHGIHFFLDPETALGY